MKAAKPSPPKPVKEMVKTAKEALGAHQLPTAVVPLYLPKERAWKVSARNIAVKLDPSLPGHWRVNMGWTMVPLPPQEEEMLVTESSIGLYGVQVPAFGGGEKEICLVRYDVSLTVQGS